MQFKPSTFADERRLKHPAKWLKIDSGHSPTGAIQEFCRQCMQSHTSVPDCPDTRCPLFPYRPGANRDGATQRRPGIDTPSDADYKSLIEAWTAAHPEQAERAKVLGAAGRTARVCDICQRETSSVVVRDGLAYCEECDDGDETDGGEA